MGYIIYTKDDCSFCVKAKELLSEKGVIYKEINIMNNVDDLYEFLQQGFKTVPQIFDSTSSYIGGYNDLVKFFSDVELQQNK